MSHRYSCSQPLISLMDSCSQSSRDVELKIPRFTARVGVFINASLITPSSESERALLLQQVRRRRTLHPAAVIMCSFICAFYTPSFASKKRKLINFCALFSSWSSCWPVSSDFFSVGKTYSFQGTCRRQLALLRECFFPCSEAMTIFLQLLL